MLPSKNQIKRYCKRSFQSVVIGVSVFVSWFAIAAHAQAQNLFGPFSAVLIGRERSTLSSELAGQVTALPFDLGSSFHKGDDLVRFDCRFQDLALAKAEREEEIAKKKWESLAKLAKLDSTGELQVELALLEWKKLEIDRRTAALLVARCTVKAPYDGRVVRHVIQPFEYVNIGQPLIEIAGTRNIEVESAVPAAVAMQIKPGQKMIFRFEQQAEPWPGKLIAVAPIIDPVSQLVAIRAVLDSAPSAVIGATGTMQIVP